MLRRSGFTGNGFRSQGSVSGRGWFVQPLPDNIPVLAEVDQRMLYGFDHRPGSDGGTGKLVKHSTILFYVPLLGGRIAQRATIKTVYPVGFPGFNTVSEPRGFPVVGDPHAQYAAVQINAYQQSDFTGITIRSNGRQDHANWLAIAPGHPGLDRFTARLASVGGQGDDIAQHIVVVLVFGNDLEQGPRLGPLGLFLDAVFGDALGQGNGATRDDGKQPKADGTATDRGRNGVHRLTSTLAGHATLGLVMTVGSGRGVVVDKRHREIHQQHTEGYCIGVIAPDSNQSNQHANAGPIDEFALMIGGSGHQVDGVKA